MTPATRVRFSLLVAPSDPHAAQHHPRTPPTSSHGTTAPTRHAQQQSYDTAASTPSNTCDANPYSLTLHSTAQRRTDNTSDAACCCVLRNIRSKLTSTNPQISRSLRLLVKSRRVASHARLRIVEEKVKLERSQQRIARIAIPVRVVEAKFPLEPCCGRIKSENVQVSWSLELKVAKNPSYMLLSLPNRRNAQNLLTLDQHPRGIFLFCLGRLSRGRAGGHQHPRGSWRLQLWQIAHCGLSSWTTEHEWVTTIAGTSHVRALPKVHNIHARLAHIACLLGSYPATSFCHLYSFALVHARARLSYCGDLCVFCCPRGQTTVHDLPKLQLQLPRSNNNKFCVVTIWWADLDSGGRMCVWISRLLALISQ